MLLSAFACDPRHGSEPGNGWNWATALAGAGCDVVVLVPEHTREPIELEVASGDRARLRFEFVPVPGGRLVRRHKLPKLRYLLWQMGAWRRARRLVARESFDVVHHVTYGSLQGGSFLGRLGLPFVFGPVGGGQVSERELAPWYGRAWTVERVRTLVTRWAGGIPPTRSAVRRASVVVVVNDDTAALARRIGARSVVPMLDAALAPEFFPDDVATGSERRTGAPFRILWLGRALPRKGLNLALRAFDRADLADAELVVVGGGPCLQDASRLAESLRCAPNVRFTGYRPRAEVRDHLRAADLFLFTSLRDSGGSQLLEAAAFGLPMVVLDHHGAGDRIPDAVARKIPITEPGALVEAIGQALRELAGDPATRHGMAEAARRFALAHTWSEHARQMLAIYEDAVRGAAIEGR